MITLTLGPHMAENYKAIQELKNLGFNDEEIQKMVEKQEKADKQKEAKDGENNY